MVAQRPVILRDGCGSKIERGVSSSILLTRTDDRWQMLWHWRDYSSACRKNMLWRLNIDKWQFLTYCCIHPLLNKIKGSSAHNWVLVKMIHNYFVTESWQRDKGNACSSIVTYPFVRVNKSFLRLFHSFFFKCYHKTRIWNKKLHKRSYGVTFLVLRWLSFYDFSRQRRG